MSKRESNMIHHPMNHMNDLFSEENLRKFEGYKTESGNSNEKLCMRCNSSNLTVYNHVLSCDNCGTENEYYLDLNPEWTNYDSKDDSSGRCGCPTNFLLPQSSLGTKIDENCRMKRMLNWDNMPYKERSLLDVLKEIKKRCKKHNVVTPVIDNAKNLYKLVNDKDIIIRGLNRQSIKAACIFYGSKMQNDPRSPKEIVDIFDNELTLKDVNSGCRKFLDLIGNHPILQNIPSSEPGDFIKRFKKKLNIGDVYVNIAVHIADNVTKLGIASNHQPTSVAAGSMLLTSLLHSLQINKKTISDCFNITEVTLTKTFKKIFTWKRYVVDDILTHNKYKSTQDEVDYESIDNEFDLEQLQKKYILKGGNLIKKIEKRYTENDFISPNKMYDTFSK